MNPALLSSKRLDWETPPDVVELVAQLCDYGIGLDPAGSESGRLISRYRNWTREGTTRDWLGCGLVYCNPPYGREIVKWVAHGALCFEKRVDDLDQLCMLVPARTDTRWWQYYAVKADAICFWRGRISFVGAENGATFPSAFLYFGASDARFERVFAPRGWLVRP